MEQKETIRNLLPYLGLLGYLYDFGEELHELANKNIETISVKELQQKVTDDVGYISTLIGERILNDFTAGSLFFQDLKAPDPQRQESVQEKEKHDSENNC